MLVPVENINDIEFSIEQAENMVARTAGMIDGFPVHDGKIVYCEFIEYKDLKRD